MIRYVVNFLKLIAMACGALAVPLILIISLSSLQTPQELPQDNNYNSIGNICSF